VIPKGEQPITRAELARAAGVSTKTIDRARADGLEGEYRYGASSPRFYLSISLPWLAQWGEKRRRRVVPR
jgi:hypothetical protein